MNGLLDYIVSEQWAFITVFILLCAVPTIMISWRPFKNLFLARFTQFGISLLAFSAIMYLMLSEHGYAVEFINGLCNGKELCLIEKHYESDGDAGSSEAYRLYVLDINTGEQRFRMNIQYPEMLCMTDSSVFFFEGERAVEYSLKNGELLGEKSSEKGFERYPELHGNIMTIQRESGVWECRNEAFLFITTKDGQQFGFDLRSGKIHPGLATIPDELVGFQLDENYLTFVDPANGKRALDFHFEVKQGQVEQLVSSNVEGTKMYEGDFLEPEFVAYSASHELFVIRRYHTLEQKSVILEAVSFDLKPLWRFDQQQQQVKDGFSDEPLPGICFGFEDHFFATFGGAVVDMDIMTGQVKWRVSL